MIVMWLTCIGIFPEFSENHASLFFLKVFFKNPALMQIQLPSSVRYFVLLYHRSLPRISSSSSSFSIPPSLILLPVVPRAIISKPNKRSSWLTDENKPKAHLLCRRRGHLIESWFCSALEEDGSGRGRMKQEQKPVAAGRGGMLQEQYTGLLRSSPLYLILFMASHTMQLQATAR